MTAPLFATLTNLTEFQLVSDALNFELPLLLANIRLYHGILSLISLKFASQVILNVAATEVKVLIDVISALLSMDLVSQVGITLHIVVRIVSIVVGSGSILADNGLLELESPCKSSLGQLE